MVELASRTATGGGVGDTFEGFVIEAIQADGIYAWKEADAATSTVIASSEIGSFRAVPNVKDDGSVKVDADYVAQGLLPLISGFTLTNGATDNPKFALMFPTFVSGNDLLVPDIGGRFLRNLGGDAAAFMVAQNHALQDHDHSINTNTANNGPGATTNMAHIGWNGAVRQTGQGYGTASIETGANVAIETRPSNFAMQFCLVLDGNEVRITNLATATPGQIPVLQADGTFLMEDKA